MPIKVLGKASEHAFTGPLVGGSGNFTTVSIWVKVSNALGASSLANKKFPLVTVFEDDVSADRACTLMLETAPSSSTTLIAKTDVIGSIDLSRSFELDQSPGLWFMLVARASGSANLLTVLDPNGNIVHESTAEISGGAAVKQFGLFRRFPNISGAEELTVDEIIVSRACVWSRIVQTAELQSLAISKDPVATSPTDLLYYYDDTVDWNLNGGVIPDLGAYGLDITAPASWGWTAEGPDAPLEYSSKADRHNGHDITVLTRGDGTAYLAMTPVGAPAPSDSDVLTNNLSANLLEVVSISTTGQIQVVLSSTNGASRTSYDYHLLHSSDGGSTISFRDSAVRLFTTCGYVDLNIVDIVGNPRHSLTGINWLWFDQTDGSSQAVSTDNGTVESTDGSGYCLIDLPNSALGAGQKGILTLVLDTDVPTSSASYVLTTK